MKKCIRKDLIIKFPKTQYRSIGDGMTETQKIGYLEMELPSDSPKKEKGGLLENEIIKEVLITPEEEIYKLSDEEISIKDIDACLMTSIHMQITDIFLLHQKGHNRLRFNMAKEAIQRCRYLTRKTIEMIETLTIENQKINKKLFMTNKRKAQYTQLLADTYDNVCHDYYDNYIDTVKIKGAEQIPEVLSKYDMEYAAIIEDKAVVKNQREFPSHEKMEVKRYLQLLDHKKELKGNVFADIEYVREIIKKDNILGAFESAENVLKNVEKAIKNYECYKKEKNPSVYELVQMMEMIS